MFAVREAQTFSPFPTIESAFSRYHKRHQTSLCLGLHRAGRSVSLFPKVKTCFCSALRPQFQPRHDGTFFLVRGFFSIRFMVIFFLLLSLLITLFYSHTGIYTCLRVIGYGDSISLIDFFCRPLFCLISIWCGICHNLF